MVVLYHYTCDHGRAALGGQAEVLPIWALLARSMRTDQIPPVANFSWFTDLASPQRKALGLTSNILKCDRTMHRYRVVPEAEKRCAWWMDVRDRVDEEIRRNLESVAGVKPGHWWVATMPVAVFYDPVRADVEQVVS